MANFEFLEPPPVTDNVPNIGSDLSINSAKTQQEFLNSGQDGTVSKISATDFLNGTNTVQQGRKPVADENPGNLILEI